MLQRLAKIDIAVRPLLLLLLLLPTTTTEGKRYDISPGWFCNNSGEVATSSSGAQYRILKFDNATEIVSDSGAFALAFLDPSGGGETFYLSVIRRKSRLQNGGAAAVAAVWIANRNASIGAGGSNRLLLTQHEGKIILITGSTAPVWSPGSNFSSMELRDDGELLLLGEDNSTLWRSFHSPSDTLLEGQQLTSNMILTSAVSSSSFLMGSFTAALVGDGVLQLSMDPKATTPLLEPQPYLEWNFSNDCGRRQGGAAVVLLQSGALVGSSGVTCRNKTLPVAMKTGGGSSSGDMFLRLESDGDLVSYQFDAAKWDYTRSAFSLSATLRRRAAAPCDLPFACGAYGYCDSDRPSGAAHCRCIVNGTSDYGEGYSATCPAAPPPRAVLRGDGDECENSAVNHHFLKVENATYFTTLLLAANEENQDASYCCDLCAGSCTCAAVFYEYATRRCFFVNGTLVGSLVRGAGMDAFLKFANPNFIRGPIPVAGKSKSSDTTRNIVRLVVGALAGVAVLLFVALLITLQRNRINRRRRKLRDLSRHEESCDLDEILSGARGLPQRFTYACLEAATWGFARKLGAGGFGPVYEGELIEGGTARRLAVKKLEGAGGQGLKQFVAEVASMGSISHVNVLKLCGFCVESSHRLLVYEFMPNGSLDRWLFEPQKQQYLTWPQRVEVALGVARGLAYLHEECREPIIHLDVKPQNILLDERMVPKVADFGMAKLLADRDVSHVVTCVRGTPGYLAPEWLLHSIATKKCDVYSYGMVLLELLGGRRNLDIGRKDTNSKGASSSTEQKLSWYFPAWAVNEVREGRFMQLLDERVRAEAPEKMAVRMVRLALWCIQEASNLRPAMQEVVQMLEGHRDVEEPPMSFHFAVQTMVDIVASNEEVSMAYVTPPSFDVSSLVR